MMKRQKFQAMTIALILAGSAEAHALEGKFRGMYVCSKLPTTRDVLRAPIDLLVRDNAVQFARPLFNLDGTRVVGTELAAGTVDGDGTLHLTSEWSFLGNISKASYTGALTPAGGTLTGSQNWTGPDGATPLSRPCAAAFVPAPESPIASHADEDGAGSTEDQP
jgi:hypothetical protein